MALQSSTVNTQGRGLEAAAVVYREMRQVPASLIWEKPQGKNPPLKIEKSFAVTPRGIALVIASSATSTLNSYPALFASLMTGNAVIIKAPPEVILSLAITVAVARQVLKEAGLNCVMMDSTDDYKGMSLCLYSEPAPRVLLVSREGVQTPDGLVSSDQVGKDMAFAMGKIGGRPGPCRRGIGRASLPGNA